MFKFFEAVATLFVIIGRFIIDTVLNIISLILFIVKGYQAVSLVLFHLPTFFHVFALTVISYCIVINVLKKGG